MAGAKGKGLRILIGVMALVVASGLLLARTYYSKKNKAVDPRIREARQLYEGYNQVALSGDYYQVFRLLDRIDSIYAAIPHYEASYERGVLANNRAASLLTLGLFGDSIPATRNPFTHLEADSMVGLAEQEARHALSIYETWNSTYEDKSEKELCKLLIEAFPNEAMRTHRADEIQRALAENDRRSSVCHTNLGVICRFQGQYEEAVMHYETAIALWDRNLDAENNLNRMLGLPLKKRTLLQKLFPPSRDL